MVSVIIPVYNGEKTLRRCVESVAGQSYDRLEILLIDDGSTDDSLGMARDLALADERIRVIRSPVNEGPSAARNKGIDDARGELLLFVDADDCLEPDALASLVAGIDEHEADISVADFIKIKDDGSTVGSGIELADGSLLSRTGLIEQTLRYLKQPNKSLLFAFSWGRLFKTSIIRQNRIRFSPDLRTFEDVAFNFDYLNCAEHLYFSAKRAYRHALHDDFTSASMTLRGRPENLLGFRSALLSIERFLKLAGAADGAHKMIGHARVSLTIIQLVRICGQAWGDASLLHKFIEETIRDPRLQESLPHYSPTGGDSNVIPLLMRWRLVRLLIMLCRYKAKKRYGRVIA